MAFNRIDGPDDLYVGGIWALRRPKALDERNITHILSVVNFKPSEIRSDGSSGGARSEGTASTWEQYGKNYRHMIIDIDDMDDEDLLVHLPKAVRFIEEGLYPTKDLLPSTEAATMPTNAEVVLGAEEQAADDEASAVEDDAVPRFAKLKLKPASSRADGKSPGAVYVHCAMGKSRSVSVVVAYLLWKYPKQFGRSAAAAEAVEVVSATNDDNYHNDLSDLAPNPGTAKVAARAAVDAAIAWVRRSRQMADPNWGFRSQLQMWWEMGCPDDVERQQRYRKWAFGREVERSVECGMAPTILRFEDEERELDKNTDHPTTAAGAPTTEESSSSSSSSRAGGNREIKCRKCRRSLATEAFIVSSDHESLELDPATGRPATCQHHFVEPLSWMRPALEQGQLEGRLMCPNVRCGASVGRYSWKGLQCSCAEWITPAFALQKARVDETTGARGGGGGGGGSGGGPAQKTSVQVGPTKAGTARWGEGESGAGPAGSSNL